MKSINIPGFSVAARADDKLAIAVYGDAGSGKTRFACTAPGVVGFVPLDRKARATIDIVRKELGKTIVVPDQDFIRCTNPIRLGNLLPECPKWKAGELILPPDPSIGKKGSTPNPISPPMCCAKHYYRYHVHAVKQCALTMYEHPDIDSIVIDTASQFWEDIMYAHFGRAMRVMPVDRGPANQEMIDMLNSLSGKHLVLTHKAKEIWKANKPTGKFEWSGFPHMDYHTNCVAEMWCDPDKGMDDEERFYLNVALCQSNPDIQGPNGNKLLTDGEISFAMLATKVWPDADVEDFL